MRKEIESSALRWERAAVLALAAGAVLRVLLFAAAFPFFTNVDEHRHVDMVLKYARGYTPQPGHGAYETQMPRLLALYGSPEYARSADDAAPPLRPAWDAPRAERARRIRANERFLAAGPNIEAFQPPAYYRLAAEWLSVGRLLGLGSGASLYWIRALNALFLAGLVLCAYALLRESHPSDALVRLGVPGLLACFPQDIFYYATGDAFSPLVCGLGFVLALRVGLRPERGALHYVAAGAVAALALLTKYTNLPLLCVCLLCTGWILAREADLRRWPGVAKPCLFWIALLAPLAAWLARNYVVFGDATATALKLEVLGWGRRPVTEWLDHPLFSLGGLLDFASGLLPTFWRGELVWHREVLAWPPADALYAISSLVLVALAAFALRRGARADRGWLVEAASLAALLISIAVLAVLSLAFVFHARSNPSADLPYFIQGRLIAGALLPFCILYVRGIQIACAPLAPRTANAAATTVLALVAALALASEAALTRTVFASPYNFYHLP
jgi:hypothetical protein